MRHTGAFLLRLSIINYILLQIIDRRHLYWMSIYKQIVVSSHPKKYSLQTIISYIIKYGQQHNNNGTRHATPDGTAPWTGES